MSLLFRSLHISKLHAIVITFFSPILPVFSLHHAVNSISLLVLLKQKEKQNFGRYSYFSLYAKLHNNNKQEPKDLQRESLDREIQLQKRHFDRIDLVMNIHEYMTVNEKNKLLWSSFSR